MTFSDGAAAMGETAARFLSSVIRTLQKETLDRREDLLARRESLAKAKAKLEDDIAHERKVRAQESEAILEKRKVAIDTEIENLKKRAEQKKRSYERFLEDINKTREYIENRFPDLNAAIISVIHHRATNMLDDMYHNADASARRQNEIQLVHLLELVQDDLRRTSSDRPEKALQWIRGAGHHVAAADDSDAVTPLSTKSSAALPENKHGIAAFKNPRLKGRGVKDA